MDFTSSLAQAAPDVVVGPFALLILAIPVLLLGEQLVKRVGVLGRSNIPAPILSGLLVAMALLVFNQLRPGVLRIDGQTDAVWWLWPLLPQWDFATPRPAAVERPLLLIFFTCVGLNASWAVARRGGLPLLVFLLLATGLALLQNVVGVIAAKAMGESALLGVLCGGVTLMGGFGTNAAFAPEFEKAGLEGAQVIGVASAALGVILGGLVAGPLAGRLIVRKVHAKEQANGGAEKVEEPFHPHGFFVDMRSALARPMGMLIVLAVVLVSLKLGAFLSSYFAAIKIGAQNLVIPGYIGAMIVAAVIRNAHDLLKLDLIKTERVDLLGTISLAWLLAVVMVGLQLSQLASAAAPMVVLVVMQTVIACALAYWVVFRVMGRDYEAAAMSAGMIGFATGATSNAVATMKALARRFGPAPKAFLIVTVVGAFLIDFTNAMIITAFLQFFRG